MDSLIARSEYAALDSCVYLNQAALGLIPTRCLSAMLRFMSEVAQYGNLRLSDEEELRVLDELRVAAASLLGTAPASVAITGGASEALGQAAALVGTVDASVVLVSSDFPSVSYPWLLSAQRSRTRIVTVDDRRGEDLTAGLVDAIDESTTAVCFSAVQYGTGTEVDVRAVADRAHAAGARVIVDATQIAGAAPVDMAGWDADAVVCSGYKWLSSHGGAALFALDAELVDETPQLVGWKGTEHPFAFDAMSLSLAPDARRFEMSTIAYASAVGLCESITMLSELDLRRIQAHARRLAASLVERVAPLGWSPFRDLSDPASSGHIVALTHPTLSSGTAQRFLAAEHRVICSDRNGCLRVSLHAYNDDSDIEALVHGLAEVGATARARIIQRPTARHTQTPEAPANNVFDPSLCHRPTLRYQQDYVPNRPGRPTVTLMATHGADQHHHGHVHLDEADWEALAAHTELEGELLLAFVTDSARWIAELRGPDAPPVRRLLDIGSGPGVGTCELARLFPDAQVVAVDGSPAMLERATRRAAAHGLDRRITTHLAELPDGLDGLDVADVIWASMSLHHIGDETNALRVLRDLLEPPGLLAIAEVAEPMRVLPDDLDVGRPGLADRLDRAECSWLAAMRAGLSGSVPSTDLASMLTSAGLDVVGSRLARERFDPPLSDTARQVVLERIRRVRQQLDELLDDEDLHTLDMLSDADDPRSVVRRPDVFLAASRQIVVARPRQDP